MTLKAYIYQAVEVEESGVKVSYKKTTEFKVPEEFQKKLDKNRALKKAFESLTPGRQRGYLFYFSQAKQILRPVMPELKNALFLRSWMVKD